MRKKLRRSVLGASLAILFLAAGWPAWAQDTRAGAGVEQLVAQIIQRAPQGKVLRIAVADFPDLQGVTSDFGRFIASRLTTRLADSGRFWVVERQRLRQVLQELKFGMSDLVDPSKAKQLGRMVGVEALLVGAVSDLGTQVDVDARMIDIETGRTVLGTSVSIAKDPTVIGMLERGREAPGHLATPDPGEIPKSPSARPVPRQRFSNQKFSLELDAVEVLGDEVKFLFVYTNREERDRGGGVVDKEDLNQNYIVDDRGRRYGYKGDSLGGKGRRFSPQVPERVWVSFQKPQAGSSTVTLRMLWANDAVLIRNIQIGR